MFLSYGDRPMRDFVRGYAFTPCDHDFEVGIHDPFAEQRRCADQRHSKVRACVWRAVQFARHDGSSMKDGLLLQVYEDFGGPHQALVICGSTATCGAAAASSDTGDAAAASWQAEPAKATDRESGPNEVAGVALLQEVRILAQPGASKLLDFAGASVCYTIGSEARPGSQYGPGLVVQRRSNGSGSGGGIDVQRQPGEQPGDEHSATRMDAEAEAAVCRHIAKNAAALLEWQPTSIAEDEELLHRSLAEQPQAGAPAAWSVAANKQLALQYRLSRKRLLRRVATNLELQERMVSLGMCRLQE